MWAEPLENVSSGICGQWRPRSTHASAQADQDLLYPPIESLRNVERKEVEQSFWSEYTSTLTDLDFYCLHLTRRYCFSYCVSCSKRAHNVETTSFQRWCNVLTLNRRCFNGVCLLRCLFTLQNIYWECKTLIEITKLNQTGCCLSPYQSKAV